jgi:hypothetical protein
MVRTLRKTFLAFLEDIVAEKGGRGAPGAPSSRYRSKKTGNARRHRESNTKPAVHVSGKPFSHAPVGFPGRLQNLRIVMQKMHPRPRHVCKGDPGGAAAPSSPPQCGAGSATTAGTAARISAAGRRAGEDRRAASERCGMDPGPGSTEIPCTIPLHQRESSRAQAEAAPPPPAARRSLHGDRFPSMPSRRHGRHASCCPKILSPTFGAPANRKDAVRRPADRRNFGDRCAT